MGQNRQIFVKSGLELLHIESESKTLASRVVDGKIPHRWERETKKSLQGYRIMRLTIIRNKSKQTIYTKSKTINFLPSRRWWMVRSHIGWRGEQKIPYKGIETFP